MSGQQQPMEYICVRINPKNTHKVEQMKTNVVLSSHDSPCHPFLQLPSGHFPDNQLHGPVKQLHFLVQFLPKYHSSQAAKTKTY